MLECILFVFFFFKQKTAYEMRISDWSSDVCSSDLKPLTAGSRYKLKLLTQEAEITVQSIERIVDTQTLENSAGDQVERNAVAEITQIGRASCRERVCQYV